MKLKQKAAAYPYIVWLLIFIVVPLLLVLYFSITKQGGGLTLDNYRRFMEPVYGKVLLRSLNLALVSTVLCLILGYPMAMIIARTDISKRNLMVLLFVLPMWMNFLLRTYAWMTLLGKNGVVNNVLEALNLPALNLLYNNGAVILGMVYNFLPFMILPIYSVLSKIDNTLIEAAKDLGANEVTVFRKVIFPMSLPGVISGITMVFMPALTTFVIPRLLGGGQFMLIGNLVEQQFTYVYDWHFGSAISIIMMLFILLAMGIMSRFEDQKEEGGLW